MKYENRKPKAEAQRILGIDPGFGRMGWGVIEKKGGDWRHVAHGCVETDSRHPFAARLAEVHMALLDIIRSYSPTRAAVEELFFYKNITTAMRVSEARGVMLLTLLESGIPTDECAPLQVKQAIVGNGRAEKRQMQMMIPLLLDMKKEKIQDDAADALAVALTAASSVALRSKMNGKR